MAEKLKEHKDTVFIIGIGLFLAIAGIIVMSGMVALPYFASAATQTVGVTAYVRPWLTFSVNPSSVTLSPDLVGTDGGLGIGSSTQNVSLIVGTNSGGGWNITIYGANGGLASTTPTTSLIATVPTSATTTLSAGTDGYGANATPSITNVIIGAGYGGWGTPAVGAISTSTYAQTIATKNSANGSTTVALIKVYAAATSTKPSGTYTDTITLTATSQ